MSSNIFSGSGDQKKQDEFNSKVETHSKAILTIIERQKNLESSNDLLNEKIELLDHNMIKQFKQINLDIQSLREEIRDLQSSLVKIKEFNMKTSKQFKLTTTKDEIMKLEKYIDFWNPMGFVTRDELEENSNKLKKEIEEIVKNFLN